MPQSALDVAPSSSPTGAAAPVPDPPPPLELASQQAARHALAPTQLHKLCFQPLPDSEVSCHATRVPADSASSWLVKNGFLDDNTKTGAVFYSYPEATAPFLVDLASFSPSEPEDAAHPPPRPGANLGTSPQDVSLITQAPRRPLKRKAEDESAPCPLRPRVENDGNEFVSHKVVQDCAFFSSSTGEDTTSEGKQAFSAAADGAPIHREDSDWSITTDVSLDDSAARMPLGPIYTDSACNDSEALQIAEAESDAESEDEDEVYAEFDPYRFMKYLPPLNLVVPDARDPVLPAKAAGCKKMTLVLDLDETLVHSSLDSGSDPDFSFVVDFNQQQHVVNVRQRPHLYEFLNRAAELFEVVIFTASQQVYAEQLLDILDPEHELIHHRIYRDSCVYVDGNYLKDLTVLGRDLQHTIIVDNSPHAFGFQIGNGIPIESWYDDENDKELQYLLPFLEKLSTLGDVRPMITDTYKMQELVAMADEPGHLS